MKTFLGFAMTDIQWPRSFSPLTLAPIQTRPMQLSRPRTDDWLKEADEAVKGEWLLPLDGAEAPDSDLSVNPERASSCNKNYWLKYWHNLDNK